MDIVQQRANRSHLQLQKTKNGSKFKRLVEAPEYHKIVDLLTAEKGKSKGTKKTLYQSIARGDLTEDTKVWFYFISSVLFVIKAPQHSEKERSNPPLCITERVQNKCGEDN